MRLSSKGGKAVRRASPRPGRKNGKAAAGVIAVKRPGGLPRKAKISSDGKKEEIGVTSPEPAEGGSPPADCDRGANSLASAHRKAARLALIRERARRPDEPAAPPAPEPLSAGLASAPPAAPADPTPDAASTHLAVPDQEAPAPLPVETEMAGEASETHEDIPLTVCLPEAATTDEASESHADTPPMVCLPEAATTDEASESHAHTPPTAVCLPEAPTTDEASESHAATPPTAVCLPEAPTTDEASESHADTPPTVSLPVRFASESPLEAFLASTGAGAPRRDRVQGGGLRVAGVTWLASLLRRWSGLPPR